MLNCCQKGRANRYTRFLGRRNLFANVLILDDEDGHSLGTVRSQCVERVRIPS